MSRLKDDPNWQNDTEAQHRYGPRLVLGAAKKKTRAQTDIKKVMDTRSGSGRDAFRPCLTDATIVEAPETGSAVSSVLSVNRGRAPEISIRLDSQLTAGFVGNRYDVVIRGVAVAAAPINEISLLFDGKVVSQMLSGHLVSAQQVFSLTLAQRYRCMAREVGVELVMRTQDGYEHRQPYTIEIDAENQHRAQVSVGPVCELSHTAKALIPIIMYAETAAIGPTGELQVCGWAVALLPLLAIQVFVDDNHVGSGHLGKDRRDIAIAFPEYPQPGLSGFDFSLRLPPDAREPPSVRIEAIDTKGNISRAVIPVQPVEVSPEPPSLPVHATTDTRRAIFLHCDESILTADGQITASGWAVCATGIAAVSLDLDGQSLGETEIGLLRPDVMNEYPGIPQARFSGFRLTKQLPAQTSGEHSLRLVARNGLDDTRTMTVILVASDQSFPSVDGLAPQDSGLDTIRLEVDSPIVIAGQVPDPVVSRLTIEGWALARSGVKTIDVFLDDQKLGPAYFGTARRDVEEACPGWPDALRSGYIFHCPPRVLEDGWHTIQLRLTANDKTSAVSSFRIEVQKGTDSEEYATIRRRMSGAECDLNLDILERLHWAPTFRLILRATGVIDQLLIAATLTALRGQIYKDWRLWVVTDSATLVEQIQRIAIKDNLTDSISFVNTHAATLSMAAYASSDRPCYIGILSPGDELGCDALVEIAIESGTHQHVDFFYADEDRVSPVTGLREPFFKPDWSPDLLLSTNYIGRPWFATAALFEKLNPATCLLVERGDYDLVLRCTEQATAIRHLPKLLGRRGQVSLDSEEIEQLALAAAAKRRGIHAELGSGCIPGTWRLKRTSVATGMVSIIIPTCAAHGYIKVCIETLRAKTAYRNFEIVCIDNIPADLPDWKTWIRENADKVVDIPGAFNWSRFNNEAASQTSGEFLLFLNDDIEVERADWLDGLLEHAQRSEVGIVGPQLLYPDRKVQHAGIFLTFLGAGRHAFRFLAEDDPGYFGLALTQRNSIAVTGACMLIRRDVFDRIGRFDEAHEVVNNDVDCCLRAWRAGMTVVYTPHSQLIHHELASRAKLKDTFNAGRFARQWRMIYADGDPFFSPRLTKFADEYRPDTEPTQSICVGRPLYRPEEVKNILAVKLDHIGDIITALPALRRLKGKFPSAKLHLLASRAARSFIAVEDCIDEVIEFEFFHSRSDLGKKELSEEELLTLRSQLTQYRFDIAVDLRKQLETRHILKYTPARLLAGYNYLGRFPWLDITLEWEGDNPHRPKRSHVSDDLLRLAEAIIAAGESDRNYLPAQPGRPGTLPKFLSKAARALFKRPVVAVHPGVGAIMRQWPAEHFASLIDLLVEKNAVNVVLIGGADEAALADEVFQQVVNKKSVISLAGRTSLVDLQRLLVACALYVGNNSGPKHIAAGLGVPTIGIHSGIVDAKEWGPLGPRAIALQRNMVCSPCYLVKPDDCVRGMACLKGLEPGTVQQYCEMMLARPVQMDQARVSLRRA
jgi:ADP-heptose:LPS heptosyltransferase/GT2 family glycosyltransferase